MKKHLNQKKLRILLTIILFLILGGFSSLRNLTYDSGTKQVHLDFNWWKLFLIAVLSWMTMAVHFNRKKRTSCYGRTLLYGSFSHRRIYYLDYVRAAATVMVIGTHAISSAAAKLSTTDSAWFPLEAASFLCHASNLLFVMVSGALLLTKEKEKLTLFYLKRVAKVALPMVLYYLCYLILLNGSAALRPDNWKNIFNDILHGSPNVPHFWLIYIILFLYVITPVLQSFAEKVPDQKFFLFTAAFLIFDTTVTYFSSWYKGLGSLTMTASWITVFLLGSFLFRSQKRWYSQLLLWAGVFSALYSLFIIKFDPQQSVRLYHTAPSMILISSSLFLAIKKGAGKKKTIPPVIACISRYSFSILLIHWYILFYIVEEKLHFNGLSFHIWGGIILTVASTLILSLCFAFFFDNTVVLCADAVIEKMIYLIGKNKRRPG